MPAILAAVEAAISYILQILGISQLIYGLLQQFGIVINATAKEHFPFEVQGLGLAANNQLADPTFGLAAIKTELDLIGLAIIALGNPQQTAQPVTLPTVAPSGYGGATASAAASAVWAAISTDEGTQMGFIMSAMSVYLRVLRDSLQLPLRIGDHFSLNFDCFSLVNDPTTSFNNDSASEILPTDTSVGAWLARIEPTYTWHQSGNGSWWADLSGGGGEAIVNCTLTDQEFLWFRAAAGGTLPGPVTAPVWPGLAGVTLGAAIAIMPPGDNVAVPCDGVIIAVTGTPNWAGSFSFGTAISYRNVGAVTFTDDNGEQEFAQTFSWTSGVYCPKSMRTAAGFAYRAAIGVSGTVTPFTIN